MCDLIKLFFYFLGIPAMITIATVLIFTLKQKYKTMQTIKTENGHPVIIGKFYELKYKWGDKYKYGYGWINPEFEKSSKIDIICHDGGVTYQDIENVIFIKQIKQ